MVHSPVIPTKDNVQVEGLDISVGERFKIVFFFCSVIDRFLQVPRRGRTITRNWEQIWQSRSVSFRFIYDELNPRLH